MDRITECTGSRLSSCLDRSPATSCGGDDQRPRLPTLTILLILLSCRRVFNPVILSTRGAGAEYVTILMKRDSHFQLHPRRPHCFHTDITSGFRSCVNLRWVLRGNHVVSGRILCLVFDTGGSHESPQFPGCRRRSRRICFSSRPREP